MNKPRYVVQWDAQPTHFCRTMCSLLESQVLVDMTIISNTYSIKVHKCVMAANSPYFREQLQKEPSIDKVVMNGIKHTVIKSLIEFIYCGETMILEDNIQELVAVANYFELRGIKAILPQKLNVLNPEGKDISQIKPPIFFCKNEKVRSVRQNNFVNDYMYDEDVKVVLDGNNYPIYDNSRRRTQGKSVVDEARVALAKEEAASRFALQMLQKDINVTSNLFVIEDACTEATVQTSLTTQYDEESNMIQPQENLIRNDITETQTSIASISDAYKLQEIDNKIEKDDKINKPEKCSDKLKECFQILQNEISTEYPILYKTGDGSYVNVTTEMIKNLAQSGAIHYQVVHDDGNLGDFHQYICNSYADIHNPQEEMSKECEIPKRSEPMSLKQLVDETIMPDYPENINPNMTTIIGSVPAITPEPNIEGIPESVHDEVVSDLSFNSYVMNERDSISFEGQSNDTASKSLDMICDNLNENMLNDGMLEKTSSGLEIPLKRKRGRPRKIKLEDGKDPSSKIRNEILFDDNISTNYIEDKNPLMLENDDQKEDSCSSMPDINKVDNEVIVVEEMIKEEEMEDPDYRDDSKKNPVLNLMSLTNLLPKSDKSMKSPKAKRRCTRSSNKENQDMIID